MVRMYCTIGTQMCYEENGELKYSIKKRGCKDLSLGEDMAAKIWKILYRHFYTEENIANAIYDEYGVVLSTQKIRGYMNIIMNRGYADYVEGENEQDDFWMMLEKHYIGKPSISGDSSKEMKALFELITEYKACTYKGEYKDYMDDKVLKACEEHHTLKEIQDDICSDFEFPEDEWDVVYSIIDLAERYKLYLIHIAEM